MKHLKINLKNYKSEDVNLIVDFLKRGKIIAYPTDTIYGLGCDATNARAVKRIFRIKKRQLNCPLLVLVKSYCMLHDICHVSKKQDQYIRSVWPPTTRDAQNPNYKYKEKPTTFILKSRGVLPSIVAGGLDSLAVRLPKNDFLTKILKNINQPLISTSLNISGQPVISDLSRLNVYFKADTPDLLIDAGKAKKARVSAIIDIRDINKVKLIRQ